MKATFVTGATSGLGLETACQLAARGHVLYLGSRSMAAFEKASGLIKGKSTNAKLLPFVWDMTGIGKIQNRVHEIEFPLDHLILNAGMSPPKGMTSVPSGEETAFFVNHLAHFALVNALFSDGIVPGKIVVVASDAHNPEKTGGFFPTPRFTSIEEISFPKTPISAKQRYVHSKLCNVLFGLMLHEKLKDICSGSNVIIYDPGFIPNTGLARHTSSFNKFMTKTIIPLMKVLIPEMMNVKESAECLIHWLNMGESGHYYSKGIESEPSKLARKTELQRELWRISTKLTSPFVENVMEDIGNEAGATFCNKMR